MIAVSSLSVVKYRSFEEYDLELSPATTILVGRNAAGKTNLVEALQLLTAGQSFRRPSPAELVREGEAAGRISCRMEGEGRVVDVSLDVAPGKKRFSRNGKRVRSQDVRGTVPSVLFCPDHLDICKRSASVRRGALDDFGVQLSERYARLASAYERTVEQRNALLKDPYASSDILAAWTDSLVQAGAALTIHRRALLDRIAVHFRRIYQEIAPAEEADAAYESSMGEVGPGEGRDALARRFASALEDRAEEERRRGQTLVGPHRDEVRFTVNGRDARTFGSQGQQRSVVLAWKMAEVEVTRDVIGRPPLLLLDDVMSELDEGRRNAIMGFVKGEVQTVVTTTNLGYFSDETLAAARVVRIGS